MVGLKTRSGAGGGGAEAERERELEEAATALLKEAGAFRRGRGIRSPRSEREERARTSAWEEWHECEIAELGSAPLWDEMDAVAEAIGLTSDEKAVLGMARVEEYSLREMARLLSTTMYRVRVLLASALEKCARHRGEPPVSAHALFWEEVRQKRASIYRAPYHGSRTERR